MLFRVLTICLLATLIRSQDLATDAEKASLVALLSKWQMKLRKVPISVEIQHQIEEFRPSLQQLHHKIRLIPLQHLNRMHEYFHDWAKEISDPKNEKPEQLEQKWMELQVRHRDSMVVAQDEMRSFKKRSYDVWTRVQETAKGSRIPDIYFEQMDADFNEIWNGYGKALTLSTRRWETLIAKVSSHGGIVKAAHEPVMRCSVCGEKLNLHEWILMFDKSVNHDPQNFNHDWRHIQDETSVDSFAEWANHLHFPSTCGAMENWIHMGPKQEL